ncbi:hypothetical protein OO012_09320 [Rhodobacteraceae bacterium KMM 6894]|nr:hypothetical protein [Rhodobacteraceae bacterium KMM 6894]
MTNVNYSKLKDASAAAHQDTATRLRERYRVFLAGPFIDISKDDKAAENNSSNAKRLRYALHKEMTEQGHHVYLGEDVELRTNGQKHYGKKSNAVTFERHHILNHCDALIVLPSSVGSFCEAGDWVSTPKTCEKMLMIIEKQYEGETNYVNLGPVEMARMFHASVEYLDYDDLERVLDVCMTHLEDIAQATRVDMLYGR